MNSNRDGCGNIRQSVFRGGCLGWRVLYIGRSEVSRPLRNHAALHYQNGWHPALPPDSEIQAIESSFTKSGSGRGNSCISFLHRAPFMGLGWNRTEPEISRNKSKLNSLPLHLPSTRSALVARGRPPRLSRDRGFSGCPRGYGTKHNDVVFPHSFGQ